MQSLLKSSMKNSDGFQKELLETEDEKSLLATMNLSIKRHHDKIEDLMLGYLSELEETRAKIDLAKSKMSANATFTKGVEKKFETEMLDEMYKLSKEFKRLLASDKAEINDLKHQISQLKQENLKIKQNTLYVENRTQQAEDELPASEPPAG